MVQSTPLVPVDDELVHQQREHFSATWQEATKQLKVVRLRNEVISAGLLGLLERGRADAAKLQAILAKLAQPQ